MYGESNGNIGKTSDIGKKIKITNISIVLILLLLLILLILRFAMNSKLISTVLSIIFLTLLSLFALNLLSQNQTPQDSGAIYGGELEKGYPSAGYLISESFEGLFNYCGIVNVGENRIFTAAHCVDNTKGVTIGFGDFAQTDSDLEIKTIYRNTGWDIENVREDFAVIEYNNTSDDFISTALAVAPEEGCEYYVVGYGRTGEDGDLTSAVRPRKGAQVCIKKIEDKIIHIEGADGGICLGDSGSPIFKEGTNHVVAVISSIITTPDTQLVPCYVGNSAIAVRVDQKLKEFNELAQEDELEDSGTYQALDLVEPVEDSTVIPEVKFYDKIKDFVLEQRNLTTFIGFIIVSLSSAVLIAEMLKKAGTPKSVVIR